jgi:hypothetical protein
LSFPPPHPPATNADAANADAANDDDDDDASAAPVPGRDIKESLWPVPATPLNSPPMKPLPAALLCLFGVDDMLLLLLLLLLLPCCRISSYEAG